MTGDDELTIVTVKLIPQAVQAMEDAITWTGHTRTDTINRALQVYAFVEETIRLGGTFYVYQETGFDRRDLGRFRRTLARMFGFRRATIAKFNYE